MEVIQVAATLCEVCLQIDGSILSVFLAQSFYIFMPRHLQGQMLVHIVKLSAEGYSHREVARMLCVKVGNEYW